MTMDTFFERLAHWTEASRVNGRTPWRLDKDQQVRTFGECDICPIVYVCEKEGMGDYWGSEVDEAADALRMDTDDANQIIFAADKWGVYDPDIRQRLKEVCDIRTGG